MWGLSGSLWLLHGRSDFVAENRKGRWFERHFLGHGSPHVERGGAERETEWLYHDKDNVANEFRTFVHSTQRHVTLPGPRSRL